MIQVAENKIQRLFPFELWQGWAMGRLEADLYKYAYLTRSEYHNTLVMKHREPAT